MTWVFVSGRQAASLCTLDGWMSRMQRMSSTTRSAKDTPVTGGELPSQKLTLWLLLGRMSGPFATMFAGPVGKSIIKQNGHGKSEQPRKSNAFNLLSLLVCLTSKGPSPLKMLL